MQKEQKAESGYSDSRDSGSLLKINSVVPHIDWLIVKVLLWENWLAEGVKILVKNVHLIM